MNSGYHKEKNNYIIQYAIFNKLTNQSTLRIGIFNQNKCLIRLKYRVFKS